MSFCMCSCCQGATDGIFQDVWHKIQEDQENLVLSETHGVMKALTEKYVYITETTLINMLTTINCNLTSATEKVFPRSLAFPIQRGSPYTRIFNTV